MVGVGPLEELCGPTCRPTWSCSAGPTAKRLATLFATAAGFIHVGEEDFGITMVEALAAGTPVLAVDRGGARDIVRRDRDGVLIAEATEPEQIRAGVRELASRAWDADELRRGADRFSEDRFRRAMDEVIRANGAR